MASFFPRNKIKQDFCQGCRINSNENLIPGMMIVEETASAAPKGQANLVNSQAKEPQSDRTLERTPPRSEGVTDGEPVRANLSGRQDRDREDLFFPVFFYF